MERKQFIGLALAAALGMACGIGVQGCASMQGGEAGWTTLIDGSAGLDNFNQIGDANWHPEEGMIVADKGTTGYLVSKKSYRDHQIRAEFWADHTTNSGIFIRAANPQRIQNSTSYEINVFDQRPDPSYGTAAIVDIAKVSPMPKAGGKWNVLEITAKGTQLTVVFNGQQTVSVQNSKFAEGPFALQFARGANNIPGGVIKWRKVMVREL